MTRNRKLLLTPFLLWDSNDSKTDYFVFYTHNVNTIIPPIIPAIILRAIIKHPLRIFVR